MADLKLVIGSKNISSWSLRPWLALKQTGASFEEIVIPLDRPDTKAAIARHSPSGRVPVLRHGQAKVWDSLAICEYVAEMFPKARLWPADRGQRAHARSISCEMHGGFAAMRGALPMNVILRRPSGTLDAAARADVDRIIALWSECRARYSRVGPFLFGTFSIADAMYAPVVTRLRTYEIALDGAPADYVETMAGLPAMQEWAAAAALEPS